MLRKFARVVLLVAITVMVSATTGVADPNCNKECGACIVGGQWQREGCGSNNGCYVTACSSRKCDPSCYDNFFDWCIAGWYCSGETLCGAGCILD
jgi:hypothetical protein